ncbi:hypothetical protein MUGA111182_14930 [Mucilaginibacter galii]|uniref:DUF4421 domain-containing protein n=1 Tax=Mucilaginibacter galii TaxID=2005073 RepID=A0A917J9Y0_9SPHI|nr:hypothetical protein [Mucilaginibacter galii]GGI50126.1 hypothetical protein GCM10011425_13380 [Mucilaginibacter galii]
MAKKILFVTLLFSLFLSSRAYCGWPTRPGRLIFSPSISYFTSSKDWDSVSRRRVKPNNGKFTSTIVNLYAEYGIVRRLTAVASLPYVSYKLSDSVNAPLSQSGLGDAELGLRYYLANINYKYYFTLQGTAVLPLYKNQGLGYAQPGGELRLGFSGAGKIGSKFFSLSLENGVRKYFGTDGPLQDRYSASFGITLDKKFHDQLTAGVSGIISTSSFTAFTRNIFTARDYEFTQVSLSYGHTFNSSFSMFLTASQFVAGRNTGIGTNGALALIYKIDNFLGKKVNY